MRTPETIALVSGPGTPVAALALAFEELPQAEVGWICDRRHRGGGRSAVSRARRTASLRDVLADEGVDAVVFASAELAGDGAALAALGAEKHVLIVGPLAGSSAEVEALVALAAARRRTLVASPPSLCRAGVVGLRRLVDRDALGELYHAHLIATARRPGPRADVLADLAPEAVALVLDVLADEPVEVAARTESYLGSGGADVLRAELRFATGVTAHLDVSALGGERAERLVVAGSEAAAVFATSPAARTLVLHPRDPVVEHEAAALALELAPDEEFRDLCAHFLAAARRPAAAAPGRDAAAVAAVLEALAASAHLGGAAEAVARSAAPPAITLVAAETTGT